MKVLARRAGEEMHKGLRRSSPQGTGNWEGLLQAQLCLQLGV